MSDKRPFANVVRAFGGQSINDWPALRGDFVYVVQWPDGVTKVGYAGARSRWRKFICRGAELLYLAAFPDVRAALSAETRIQENLALWYPASFRNRDEARDHLGDGCGYLECYSIEVDHG